MSDHLMRAPASGLSAWPVRSTHRRPLAAVGRWVVLLVALMGLMAMHGLSDHGVAGPLAASHASQALLADIHVAGTPIDTDIDTVRANMAVGHAANHDRSERRSGGRTTIEDSSAAVPLPDGHGGGHAGLSVAMCLAVLAALLLRGVAGWRARLLRGVFCGFARDSYTAVRAWARGPAPPGLKLLCVQRC